MKQARTVVVVGAAVLMLFATGCSDYETAKASGDLSATSAAGTDDATTQPLSDWVPLGDGDGTEPLEPGVYGLTANGLPGMPWAVVVVPHGFADLGGWVLKEPEGDRAVRGVGYWTVSAVDRNPCDGSEGFIPIGPSVEHLAAAFTAQELSKTTEPVPVTLDGHAGLYVELQVPSDIQFSDCTGGEYNVWVSDPGGGRFMQEPGQVDRLWILDVDGDIVVMQATAVPAVTRAQRNVLTDMVEAVRFVALD